jgi:hypothetical protein
MALALMLLWEVGAAGSLRAETYRGKVVDADTGEPLEGAVFVVVWYKKPLITMDGPTDFHDAKEVLTDAKGEFSLDGSPAIDWNPFTSVSKSPAIAIFKPGYGPFPFGYVADVPIQETKKALIKEGAVIKLPKLKTEQEMRKYTTPSDMLLSTSIPYDQIPNLIRLINIQRKNLGLQPIGSPSNK